MKKIKYVKWALFCAFLWQPIDAFSQDAFNGTVFVYHRFGESQHPTTNIRLSQFEEHLAELQVRDKYDVVPLPDILDALENGRSFARPTIAISADDAYVSIYEEAWPRLRAANMPLTVFVATDQLDAGSRDFMSWDQVRTLVSEGVTIGHHGSAHGRYLEMTDEEIEADIQNASRRFAQELGFVPQIFAYPYGEFDQRLIALITRLGFDVAFAQYSGPIAPNGDRFHLPRFPINEQYGSIERFRLLAQTKPLEVTDVLPRETVIEPNNNPPLYGFSISDPPTNLAQISCFPSHMNRAADTTILNNHRVIVRFSDPFPEGRNRINCTLPSGGGQWYWVSKLFIINSPQ